MTPSEQQAAEVAMLQEMRRYSAQRLGELGVKVLDGVTEEGTLRGELTLALQREELIGRILGFTGARWDWPRQARLLVAPTQVVPLAHWQKPN